jgi:hypothetical protein
MVKTTSDQIRGFALEVEKTASALEKAIAMVRKIPGWEKLVKSIWPEVVRRLEGKPPTKEAGPRELLITALVILINAMGISAQEAAKPETLNKVMTTITQQAPQQKDTTYTQTDVDSIAKVIPYDVSILDKRLLQSPFSGPPAFELALSNKVEDGWKKEVKPYVMKNDNLKNLNKADLASLIAEGLIKKISNYGPKDVKSILDKWLKDHNLNYDYIEKQVQKTALKLIEKDTDLRST